MGRNPKPISVMEKYMVRVATGIFLSPLGIFLSPLESFCRPFKIKPFGLSIERATKRFQWRHGSDFSILKVHTGHPLGILVIPYPYIIYKYYLDLFNILYYIYILYNI